MRERVRILVGDLDEGGPQTTGCGVATQRGDAEMVRVQRAVLAEQLVHTLQNELPFVGEAQHVPLDHATRFALPPDEVQNARQFQRHRVDALRRRRFRASHQTLPFIP